MKCPRCDNTLDEVQAGAIKIDLCRDGCGGIWFDSGEINSFDETKELDPEKCFSLNNLKGGRSNPPPRACPKCNGEVLVRQFFDPKHQIEVEVCWGCGGLWLDPGELSQIRNQFVDAAARQEAGDRMASQILASFQANLKKEGREFEKQLDEDYGTRRAALITAFKSLF